jgi:hypothetical protein
MVFLVPKYIQGSLISPYKISMPPNNGATTKHRNELIFMFKDPPKMMMKALWAVEIAPFTS